jgi:hypothetical protein
MSAFQYVAVGRSGLDASRRRFGAAVAARRRRIQRRLAGQIWLHRAAACAGVAGAVLVQGCVFSLAGHFIVGIDAAVLPELSTCLYGLVIGAALLGLRPLTAATVTAA